MAAPTLTPRPITDPAVIQRLHYDNEPPDGTPTNSNFRSAVVSYVSHPGHQTPRFINGADHDEVLQLVFSAETQEPFWRHVLGSPLDLTATTLRLRFFVDPNDLPGSVSVRLFDGTSVGAFRVWAVSNVGGWITVDVGASTLTDQAALDGVDLTNITRLGASCGVQSPQDGTFRFESLTVFSPPTSPAQIMIRHDDSLVSGNVLHHFSEANDRGIPLTMGLIAGQVLAGAPGYITPATLTAIAEMPVGHVIANHSSTLLASADYTNATVQERIDDIALAQSDMLSLGVPEHSGLYVVPGGSGRVGDDQVLASGVPSAMWYVDSGPWDGLSSGHYPKSMSPERLARLGSTSAWDTLSLAQIIADIDLAILHNDRMVAYTHGIAEADWEAAMDHIQAAVMAGTLEVITPRDLWTTTGGQFSQIIGGGVF